MTDLRSDRGTRLDSDRDIAWHLAGAGGILAIGLSSHGQGGGSGGLTTLAPLLAGRQHCGVPFVPVNAIDTFVAFLVPSA